MYFNNTDIPQEKKWRGLEGKTQETICTPLKNRKRKKERKKITVFAFFSN